MKILPPRIHPPEQPIERHHQPKMSGGRRGYRTYRDCLRWEFGFLCSFCLLHETDLAVYGVEGLGVMGVEHFLPISLDPDAANEYENCFYACRLCNGGRGAAPVAGRAHRLLNPCSDAWGEHFEAAGDQLVPKQGDRDAEYTARTYDLNDPRKMRLRKLRRELLSECLDLLVEGPRQVETLIGLSESRNDVEILKAAQDLQRCIQLAAREARRYAAIPVDAPQGCRCGRRDDPALPEWLDRQTIDTS